MSQHEMQAPTPQQEIADLVVRDWCYQTQYTSRFADYLPLLTTIVAAAIDDGEQRGRVAGLKEAATAVCQRCQANIPLVHWSKPNVYRHPFGEVTIDCEASAIHALIAEEAAHV